MSILHTVIMLVDFNMETLVDDEIYSKMSMSMLNLRVETTPGRCQKSYSHDNSSVRLYLIWTQQCFTLNINVNMLTQSQ